MVNLYLALLWGLVLTLFFYAASKFGAGKKAAVLIALGELIPFLHMLMIALEYYNAAISGNLGVEGLIEYSRWLAYTLAENAITDVYANMGAMVATFAIRLAESVA